MPGGDGDGVHDPASLRGVREGEVVPEEFTMKSKFTRLEEAKDDRPHVFKH